MFCWEVQRTPNDNGSEAGGGRERNARTNKTLLLHAFSGAPYPLAGHYILLRDCQESLVVQPYSTMERSLQSALEKRTRVGAWQSRVYRLERGYLSAWTDVVSAAAHEEPARTDCLFHGSQVAKLTNQGMLWGRVRATRVVIVVRKGSCRDS